MSDNLTYVKASCHCGANAFQIPFLTSKLPQGTDLCHCNACRHITGELAVHCAVLEGEPLSADSGVGDHKPADLSNLTKYSASENITRYFCSTCSAYLFYEVKGTDPHWSVSTGALERTEGIVKVGLHAFLADTLDGGLAHHYRQLNGVEIPRYEFDETGKTLPLGWKAEKEAKKDERLHAYCHCRSLDFYITRPTELSALPYAPYPDAICPVIQTRLATIRNRKDEKWWLSPSMRADESGNLVSMETGERVVPGAHTKYLAGHCVCPNCRLGSGFEVQSWSFVSRANVFEKGATEPLELMHEPDRPACLKQYLSSPGKYREFCGTCGATCFWWHVGRPDVIDVSVGLIDERDDGVRAEDWLRWYKKRVAFIEKAKLSREVARGLVEGMAAYQDPEEKD
ncbi:hypothetical protein M413DRAFT_63847 [Hebeloma cylindrosporum]|uniref:CENP-V/GFA domain-containing protein n=1 Tax=Hebeloma cylindrosporum TaxID=76867 RepID=A0A0C2YAE1_HEBCY|nr:hypothetical protein M413DRAFT_63847 [Hebeloma cylindrosporum h7]